MRALNRSAWVWIGLLATIESMDILTTAAGRASGAVETMPVSATVMNVGGMGLFVIVKLALVAIGAIAVLLALRWAESGRPGANVILAFAMSAVRVSTVALAVVSLHNAVLLQSLQGSG
ncbi:MAG: hypothetical protein ABI334_02975 [Candidatus Dormiibacterota bacterium]